MRRRVAIGIPLHRRGRNSVATGPCSTPLGHAVAESAEATKLSGVWGVWKDGSRWEGIVVLVLAVGIMLVVGIPVLTTLRHASENRAAQVSLELAIKDVTRVYMVDRGFTAPGPSADLWPYLDRRFPQLRWAKASTSPKQVAVARSARGQRQSVELGIFAVDGVCWEAIAVMSARSVAIARWAGLESPGIYYGATIGRSCGPSYVTPPGSGWQTTLSRVKVPAQF